MRRFLLCAMAAITMTCCVLLGACSNGNVTVETIYTVGTFSGHRVDFVKMKVEDAWETPVTEEYYVGETYIATIPSPSYDYLVYIEEDEYVTLKNAYDQGIVTDEDVFAIAEIETARGSSIDVVVGFN